MRTTLIYKFQKFNCFQTVGISDTEMNVLIYANSRQVWLFDTPNVPGKNRGLTLFGVPHRHSRIWKHQLFPDCIGTSWLHIFCLEARPGIRVGENKGFSLLLAENSPGLWRALKILCLNKRWSVVNNTHHNWQTKKEINNNLTTFQRRSFYAAFFKTFLFQGMNVSLKHAPCGNICYEQLDRDVISHMQNQAVFEMVFDEYGYIMYIPFMAVFHEIHQSALITSACISWNVF